MKLSSYRLLVPKPIQAIIIGVLLFGFVGCGLIPKKVEFFQDKVKPVPEKSKKADESDRQAAAFLSKAVDAAYTEAVRSNTTNAMVMVPLEAANIVAPSLSYSLGLPSQPVPDVSLATAKLISETIAKEMAKFHDKLDRYRDEVRPNEGKKIEGTGLIQIPYIGYLAGLLGLGMLAWFALKVLATINPQVALGTKVASMGGKMAGKVITELIGGGEVFKEGLVKAGKETFSREEILELFRVSHERKQSTEVQDLVRNLTKA